MRGSCAIGDDGVVDDLGRSPVKFARVDGVAIAYQTWGSGSARVTIVPPFAQNIELTWERPEFRTMFERLGVFANVVHYDKRGTGASDRADRMPTTDQRVEDVVAVLDALGWDRTHLLGVSEGGPVAISIAATYPERVETLALFGSGARIIGDETDDERRRRRELEAFYHEHWGTEDTVTLDVFAPSVAGDAAYRAWQPRYERQSASPAAVAQLLDMVEAIDVRPLLGAVAAPTLILHRSNDRVVSVARARETLSLLPTARLTELAGDDHMPHVGDVGSWLDLYEHFVTGTVTRHAPQRASPVLRIDTMGGFRVIKDGHPVPPNAWGSRQARQLCKRLAVNLDRPVTRDELADMLWPDETDDTRRGARLSVVLSNIRRVLGGGLIADRDSVRLDLVTVSIDLVDLEQAIQRGDDREIVAAYGGPVLPEDPYDDWAIAVSRRVATAIAGARRRLATQAQHDQRLNDMVEHATALLDLDEFDERAHELLVSALVSAGRHGDARHAASRYETMMRDLGFQPRDLLNTTDGS
jgi:pimeloyl-ACP methyl ester carboxylesterase/DNA-binding SARP family transcriptional activator